MSTETLIAAVALITGSCIGLGSLYFAVRHGNAALRQTAVTAQDTSQAFGQMIRLLQDVDTNLDATRRELTTRIDEAQKEVRAQHEAIRSLISAEAERVRTHSTQGHFDTRAVIRDTLGRR